MLNLNIKEHEIGLNFIKIKNRNFLLYQKGLKLYLCIL